MIIVNYSNYIDNKNSLIFTSQIENGVRQYSFLGKQMKAIQRDMSNGQGFAVSLFGKNPTKNDIQYLTDFQNQLKKGVPVGQAWNNTMTNASVAGKKAAVQIKQGTTNLSKLQQGLLSTKIATVGLQVALNSSSLSFVISILTVAALQPKRQQLYLQ